MNQGLEKMRERTSLRVSLLFLSLVMLLPAFSAPLASAGPGNVTISGIARDFESGQTLSNVKIALDSSLVITTGADGQIPVTQITLSSDKLSAKFSKPGYTADSVLVENIKSGDTVNLTPLLAKTDQQLAAHFSLSKTKDSLAGAQFYSQTNPPSTIRVYRASLGRVDIVPFNFYAKHVLPSEWIASWHANSLRAGAMAVKTYAWYWVNRGGKWPSLGADVKDNTSDQVYNPNYAHPNTDAAVDYVSDYRLTKSGQIFQSQYCAGSAGQDRDPNYPTRLTQWGSQYWADRGYGWRWILHHYYDPVTVSSVTGTSGSLFLSTPGYSTAVSKTDNFRISWGGTDPTFGSGAASYDIQYRPANSSSWTNWKTSTTGLSATFTGTPGRTYYFRVRPKDGTGKLGNWSAVRRTIVPYEQNRLIFRRAGFARAFSGVNSSYFLSKVRYSQTPGTYIAYKFSGKSVALISTKGPGRSKAKIYIDGEYYKTIDNYTSKTRSRQIVFFKSWGKSGTHYIKIVNLATPGRERFGIDGLGIGR